VSSGVKKQVENGHSLSGMEEDHVGSQGSQRTAVLEKKNINNLRCNQCLSDVCVLCSLVETQCHVQLSLP
jgi:hypothetical protein